MGNPLRGRPYANHATVGDGLGYNEEYVPRKNRRVAAFNGILMLNISSVAGQVFTDRMIRETMNTILDIKGVGQIRNGSDIEFDTALAVHLGWGEYVNASHTIAPLGTIVATIPFMIPLSFRKTTDGEIDDSIINSISVSAPSLISRCLVPADLTVNSSTLMIFPLEQYTGLERSTSGPYISVIRNVADRAKITCNQFGPTFAIAFRQDVTAVLAIDAVGIQIYENGGLIQETLNIVDIARGFDAQVLSDYALANAETFIVHGITECNGIVELTGEPVIEANTTFPANSSVFHVFFKQPGGDNGLKDELVIVDAARNAGRIIGHVNKVGDFVSKARPASKKNAVQVRIGSSAASM